MNIFFLLQLFVIFLCFIALDFRHNVSWGGPFIVISLCDSKWLFLLQCQLLSLALAHFSGGIPLKNFTGLLVSVLDSSTLGILQYSLLVMSQNGPMG